MKSKIPTTPSALFLAISFIIILPLSQKTKPQVPGRGLHTQATNQKEKRTALVIGNSTYADSPLINPVNDSRAIANVLRNLGFEVIYGEDLSQNDMKRSIRAFGTKIKQGGVGLFYYAGHGVQVNGANYLIPIGATITKEEEVEYEGVDLGLVIAQMEGAKNILNLVILDACRNNPFARSFRSTKRGLASIDAPSGTLIAYATAPGSVASDGDAQNGLYTQELLKNIQTPGLNIEDIFKKVRVSVRDKTQSRQIPWESSSLVGDFYFISVNTGPTDINSIAGRYAGTFTSQQDQVVAFKLDLINNNGKLIGLLNLGEYKYPVLDGSYSNGNLSLKASWHGDDELMLTAHYKGGRFAGEFATADEDGKKKETGKVELSTLPSPASKGAITGEFTDPNEAKLAGATVTVTNMATGTIASVKTEENGVFIVPYLPPGSYQLIGEFPGFKKYIRDGIVVRLNSTTDLGRLVVKIGS